MFRPGRYQACDGAPGNTSAPPKAVTRLRGRQADTDYARHRPATLYHAVGGIALLISMLPP